MEKSLQNGTYRIVLVGPESTGKSFLAKAIATHYDTVYVEEYLRTYAEDKYRTGDKIITPKDMGLVIDKQKQLQKEKLNSANKIIIEDTDVLQLAIYAELYFGSIPPKLKQQIEDYVYADLYLLMDIDLPWKEDLVRDAPFEREKHFDFFLKKLKEVKVPFVTINGTGKERYDKAIKNIEMMIDKTFTAQDLEQFRERNVTPEEIYAQLEVFRKGCLYMNISKPAVVGDGIIKLSDEELTTKIELFERNKGKFSIEKFVPASGAASRMFQFLNVFLAEYNFEKESLKQYIERKKDAQLIKFTENIKDFTFYEVVCAVISELDNQYHTWTRGKFIKTFVQIMLEEQYLNFANLPKAVLPFYNQKTPSEIHLNEALAYAKNDVAQIHFTISQEHTSTVNRLISEIKDKNNLEGLEVKLSYQDKTTDTICVDENFDIIRDANQHIVFRQAGHGALIENLNKIESDIIFIKNIDNVSEENFDEIVQYKKALGGILIDVRSKVCELLEQLDLPNPNLEAIENYVTKCLNIWLPKKYGNFDLKEKINLLKSVLDRPIRVCGMVLNQGKTGGGPFWVRETDGTMSLQIVEGVQINMNEDAQKSIVEQSTHFNPVDLVCCIKNYKGEKFNLLEYRNPNTGFITEKSLKGKKIFGYELPGLWNGAMYNWISVFVEVSIATFRPVKTVNDLL
ncbi:MAG: DUF4301 family protein [Bacteroidota bacterium]|nr:DUF4301 family protein [Bacteroidota bacterium]